MIQYIKENGLIILSDLDVVILVKVLSLLERITLCTSMHHHDSFRDMSQCPKKGVKSDVVYCRIVTKNNERNGEM